VTAIAIGDVDGDGRKDLALTTGYAEDAASGQKLYLYLQNVDGTLAPPIRVASESSSAAGLAIADLDGDGRGEVVVGRRHGVGILRWTPSVAPSKPPYVYRYYPAGRTDAIGITDVNRDGHADIVTYGYNLDFNVHLGTGGGGIARTIEGHLGGYRGDLKTADLDGDGFRDVVLLAQNGGSNGVLLMNDGSDDLAEPVELLYAEEPGSEQLAAIALGDFDGNGDTDILLARDSRDVHFVSRDGSGNFGEVNVYTIPADVQAMATADLDGDGLDDLVASHESADPAIAARVSLHFGGPDGPGAKVTVTSGTKSGYGTASTAAHSLAVGDIDGDGCDDIVRALEGAAVLHRGSGCPQRADLAVDIEASDTEVFVVLQNHGEIAAADAAVDIWVAPNRMGAYVDMHSVPANCDGAVYSEGQARVQCTFPPLAPGATATVNFGIEPLFLPRNSLRNRHRIDATVEATGSTPEWRLDNNSDATTVSLPL
jgi:hypothetical protein